MSELFLLFPNPYQGQTDPLPRILIALQFCLYCVSLI